MRNQHIGYQIRDFYRVAKLSMLWSTMTQDVQQRLHILDFAQRYGQAAVSEADQASCLTLLSLTVAAGNAL